MPWIHLCNCLLLSLGGPAVVFRACRLKEPMNAVSGLLSMIFTLSQLVQGALLATFAPEVSPSAGISWELEAITMTARTVDMVAVSILFDQRRMKELPPLTQVLLVGLAWGGGDLVTWKLTEIWGANQVEFDWLYLRIAAQANLVLLAETAFAAAVFVWSRRRTQGVIATFAAVVSVARFVIPPASLALQEFLPAGGAVGLAAEAALTIAYSLVSWALFKAVLQNKEHK
eukprot:Hpha_TRINITY_DN16840_c4_g9::TRINITY_DN16840_c4_g9_i1::g.152490::m.152490